MNTEMPPIRRETLPVQGEVANVPSMHANGRKTRVLFVEDDHSLRMMVSDGLRFDGFDVTTANNGPIGLQTFKPGLFDVVVTDLRMPNKGDGIRLVEEIRKQDPGVPVIVMSGTTEDITPSDRSHLNILRVMEKPVGSVELTNSIRAARRTIV